MSDLSRVCELTRREAQAADLAAEGLTNPQIAERMQISRETVKTYMQRVLEKLGLDSRRKIGEMLEDRFR